MLKTTIRIFAAAIALLSTTAHAAYSAGNYNKPYAPGTYLDIMTIGQGSEGYELLVLEHSVVDLKHNLEFLNFSFTQNKSMCDVYKGINGTSLTKSSCNLASTVYTESAVNSQDGWRIGSSDNFLDMVKLFGGWVANVSWDTHFYSSDSIDFVASTLGSTRTQFEEPSFILYLSDNLFNTVSPPRAMDAGRYSGAVDDVGYRESDMGRF